MPSNANDDPIEPPESGEIEIELPLAPVSMQARKETRDTLIEEVRQITRPLKYLLTGDVTIDLYWFLPGDLRYESDIAPDIENITKPLIDSLCGPDGLIIDDCQISAFGSEWVNWMSSDQKLILRIGFIAEHWMRKPILFVHIGKGLCMPLEDDLNSITSRPLLAAYKSAITARQQLIDLGVDKVHGRGILPVHRVFHRTRIHGFKVVELSTLESEIGSDSN